MDGISKKRNQNKKLHQRHRHTHRPNKAQLERERSVESLVGLRPAPSEFDQMSVIIDEQALGLKLTTMTELRALVRMLPFESAMVSLALLNLRAERVLTDPSGQWELACWFYESWPELLAKFAAVRQHSPARPIFSPQSIAMLMRLLVEEALEVPFAELRPGEFRRLQCAVLGAHSVSDPLGPPGDEAIVAYGLQASSFFNRPPVLEEMTRSDDFLRIMRSEQLQGSANYVPVDEWLTASGLTPEEQRVLGFGLSAAANSFTSDPPTPRMGAQDINELLNKLGLTHVPNDVPLISASRAQLQAGFKAFDPAGMALSWEFRPLKSAPFLRFSNGDLLLLGVPWILSWLGEGFHYRALTHAQSLGSSITGRYTRFVGEVVERYALELAQAAIDSRATVLGEQRYGKGGGQRTSDVAVVWGRDLILFEVHARRITASAMAGGEVTEALGEVSKLLVVKVDQVAGCIHALLDGNATLPDVNLDEIERIYPVVVSIGHLMQTRHVWKYMRESVKPETTQALAKARVQPLQLLDIADYERLLGIVEAGTDLPRMLARKTEGPFRERDFAAWLHGDNAAPSDESRPKILRERWDAMSIEVKRTNERAAQGKPHEPHNAQSPE